MGSEGSFRVEDDVETAALHALATWCRRSVHIAHKQRRAGDLRTATKRDSYDLVTAADRAIERYLRRAIRRRFPDHAVAGEEFGLPEPGWRWLWVIDPIDGTYNFATGLSASGTSIGLMRDGQVRLGAIADLGTGEILAGRVGDGLRRLAAEDRWEAVEAGRAGSARLFLEFGAERLDDWLLEGFRDLVRQRETVPRLIGSAAVALAAVARNGGCFVGVGLNAWDVVGGVGLAEAAGLSVTWWHDAFPGLHVLVADEPTQRQLEPTVAGLVATWRQLGPAGRSASEGSGAA